MIGCMSGTSLDGIDLVYVKFTESNEWTFEILASKTINYDNYWRNKLGESIYLSSLALENLNSEYTDFLGRKISDFITDQNIKVLDAVASHGHTVFHQPNRGLTLQIGNLSGLADQIGWPVVCDFRVQDVALGGQGAPLVPMGDKMLFKRYQACVNLGGFSNISIFQNHTVMAFDICAVNTVLNDLAHRLNLPYDEGGKLASKGKIIPDLLEQLKLLHFYQKKPPKSLGLEWVEENIFKIFDHYNSCKIEDLLHTYTSHIAQEIANNLPKEGSVIFTGGGTYNTFLVQEIQKLSNAKIKIPSSEIIEFKEALIFAFLGLLRWQGAVNCLASVTGAKRDHSTGKIFLPKPLND
jgi:anhydro-N-acetylmuramic acid kinase